MTPRKNIYREGAKQTTFWPIFRTVRPGFWGRYVFFNLVNVEKSTSTISFSVICKHRYFLEACLIYNSILETKEVQTPTIRIGSINVCLLSFQFYYTYETCKKCALQQRQKLCLSLLISLLKLMRNISKYHFLDRGVFLHSIIDIHCSTAEGRERPKLCDRRYKGKGVQKF